MTQRAPCILRGLNNDHEGRLFEIREILVVGRSRKCDILISDDLVSRAHAHLECREGELWVKDLDSRNGTFVNQTRVSERRMSPHDVVKIGRSEFVMLDPGIVPNTHLELVDDSQRAFAEPVIKKTLAFGPGEITDSFLAHDRRNGFITDSGSSSESNINTPQWFEVLFRINREGVALLVSGAHRVELKLLLCVKERDEASVTIEHAE